MVSHLKSSVLAHCRECDKNFPIEDFEVMVSIASNAIADKHVVINLDNIFNTFNRYDMLKPLIKIKCPICGAYLDILDDIYAPYVKAFYELGVRYFNCSSGGFPIGTLTYQDAFIEFDSNVKIDDLFIEYDGHNSLSYKIPIDFKLNVTDIGNGWYHTYISANLCASHSWAGINSHSDFDMEYYKKVKNFYMYILYRLSNIAMLSLAKANKKNLGRDHQELVNWGYGNCKNIEADVLNFLKTVT